MKKKLRIGSFMWMKLLRMLIIMKVLFIFLFVFPVVLNASPVYSQQQKMDISMKDVSLVQVFQFIREQSDYRFVYDSDAVKRVTGVSLDLKDVTVESILDNCLKERGFTYLIEGHVVIIKEVGDVSQQKKKEIRIVGKVTDEKNMSLPGVTVMAKELKLGTATDKDGRYSLTVPYTEKLTVSFSFIGMETKEVKYVGKDTINVMMKEDVKEVDEVIVTGYQTVKKRSMAGSSSSVKAEDLIMNGTKTLEQMLQGKLPGVMVINQSGLTGTRQKVRVRGTSTLVGNAEPVWVVDGIIQEDPLPFEASQLTDMGGDNMDMIKNFVGGAISWLNPMDIDNIVVLKDASSTAIYGVKAANGVIVITTKKGERGQMSIGHSGSLSMSSKMNYNRLELMNSKERVEVSREAYEKGSILEKEDQVGYMALALAYKRREISYEEFNARTKELETVNTDWFDILFRTPISHTHNISISGGSDKTTYRASFGMNNNNNTAKGNDQMQYMGNVNVSSTFWDQLVVNVGLSGSVAETKAFAETNPFDYANGTNRALPCFDANGERYFYPNGDYKYNILHELENSGNENTSNSLNSNISMRWTLWDGLTLSSTFGYNYSTSYGESWFTELSHSMTSIRGYEFGTAHPGELAYIFSPLPHGGMLNVNESRNNNYTWRNQVEFVKTYGPHAISAMVGQECRSNKYDGFSQTAYGYMPDRGKSFAELPLVTGNESIPNREYACVVPNITDRKANYLSYYGNASYMYDDRYALNGSIRVDASNRFGQDKDARFQPVWSVGFRWNVTREHWLEDQNILNDISLRASYGFQGNVAENVSPDLITNMVAVGLNSTEYQLKLKSLPAPGLKWEKNKSLNLGLDFSILGSKLNGSFEYFYKRTVDMIVDRKVPMANGVRSMVLNGGNMTNSGWDLNVSLVPVRLKDFVWTLGINTSKVYHEIKSDLEPTGKWQEAVGGGLNKDGYPVSSFWAFKFTGLNPENGAPEFDLTGAETEAAVLDATEYLAYAGKNEPDFTAGLNTSFRYKTWTLAANFYLSTGNQKFLASPYSSSSKIPSEYSNMSNEMTKRWRKPGDEAFTDIPALPHPLNSEAFYPFKLTTLPLHPYDAYVNSDIRVVDAWYLRCSNISLSYTLPESIVSRFAQDLSFSFSMSNPFQIVSKDFYGRDPEVASGQQPLSRNYSLTMNLSF